MSQEDARAIYMLLMRHKYKNSRVTPAKIMYAIYMHD